MKFTGQIRVPEIDHPGVPATFLIDGNQAEVVLDGESLGRWSLFDVRARRLVSSAFQVELGGEEITFLADEPIDFAYRGVEHMAEVWARYKAMNLARRAIAVGRSRRGSAPSKISELRTAMVENLEAQNRVPLAGSSSGSGITSESVARELRSLPPVDSNKSRDSVPAPPPVERLEIPAVGETTGDEVDRLAAARIDAEMLEKQRQESERLEGERRAIEEERARLAAEAGRLEAERREAEEREANRVEAFRLELERLEKERQAQTEKERERAAAAKAEAEALQLRRAEMERLEADRARHEREEAERVAEAKAEAEALESKRAELERLEAERARHEREEAERVAKAKAEAERLEAFRIQREAEEAERATVAKAEAEALESKRAEMERLEAERAAAALQEREALEARRMEIERLERERASEAEAEARRLAMIQAEMERLEAETERLEAETEPLETETEPLETGTASAERIEVPAKERGELVEELLATSGETEDPESSKQLVVDLGAYEGLEAPQVPSGGDDPEPALAGARDKAGIMGAVRSAFTRGNKAHTHDFVEAPGGIGIARSICRECGFVSISTAD